MSFIIEKEELLPLLNSRDIRICDCRFQLGSPDAGYNDYKKTIFQALFISILKRTYRVRFKNMAGGILFLPWKP